MIFWNVNMWKRDEERRCFCNSLVLFPCCDWEPRKRQRVRVRGSDRTCSRHTRPHNKQQSWGSILKIASCIMKQRSCGRISTASFRAGKLFHSNPQQLRKCHCAAGRLGLCFLFLNWTKFNWSLSSRNERWKASLSPAVALQNVYYISWGCQPCEAFRMWLIG